MRYLVLVALLVTSLLAQEVKHAPTVAQCQADQRLWLDKMENHSTEDLPDFFTLHEWSLEMGACGVVDPENSHRYYNVDCEISSVQMVRLMDFLDRHGLRSKFIEEDKAGKR